MQPSSEVNEVEDRCFRVAVARRWMLPHPAAPNAADVTQSCPNNGAAGQFCTKPVDLQTLLGISHHTPSKEACAPFFVPWPLSLPAGCAAFIPAPARPTAQCQYHPSGTTYQSLRSSPKKGVLVPPLRDPTLPVLMPVLVVDHSQGLCLPSYPWYVLVYPSHLDMATSTLQTVIPCIINTVSQCFSGTKAQRAGTPPRLSQRLVDGFMRSSYKRPVTTCHMSRTNSSRTQVTRTSPSCSTWTHFSPTLQSLLSTKLRQARTRWGMAVLVVRGLLRRPSLSGSPTVTFCSDDCART